MEEERLAICSKCGIYNAAQNRCSSVMYVNPETNDVSLYPKEDYYKGCGCLLSIKVKRELNHCPAHKW